MNFFSFTSSDFSESIKVFNIGVYDNRINLYKQSNKLFFKIKKDQCLVPINDTEYSIDNGNIILKHRIGSNSSYGIIYLTELKNKKFIFATKLSPVNNRNLLEINLAKKLSNITLANKNPHFLLIYKSFFCNNDLIIQKLPKLIKNDDYLLSVNELVSGNFKSIIKKSNITNELLLNCLQQILMSILSFHYFSGGLFHNDCHYGNFLYHRIKPGGYFHYNIYGEDVYIKNMGYLWLIWDFGLVRKDFIYIQRRLEDYFRITRFFLKYNSKSNKTLKVLNKILQFKENYYSIFGNSDEKFFRELFKINNLFIFQIPINSEIVNNKPFIIK